MNTFSAKSIKQYLKKSMRKALQPNQSQKRPDQLMKRRLYVGSSSAGQVHHPPHYHHYADQHPLKKTVEKK
jgi:hypothetical protein